MYRDGLPGNMRNRAQVLESMLRQIRDSPSLDSCAKAYLFTVFSIQTRLSVHERCFKEAMGLWPTFASLQDAPVSDIAALMQRRGVMFHAVKAKNLKAALEVLPDFLAEAWPMKDKDARAWVAEHVPGLAFAKSSFFLMLLGRLGCACIDLHMANLLGVKASQLRRRGSYEEVEATLGRKPGLKQWLTWMDIKGIPGVGHACYFESQGLNPGT
jgi:thermostable 8-oxoguanine DNA glycosylase